MMLVDNKFNIGQEVYLKTDKDQLKRLVLGFCVRINPLVFYELGCGNTSSWHYDFEITDEVNILERMKN